MVEEFEIQGTISEVGRMNEGDPGPFLETLVVRNAAGNYTYSILDLPVAYEDLKQAIGKPIRIKWEVDIGS